MSPVQALRIKPANIPIDARLRRPDHVYLSDFGVAKSTATVGKLPRDRSVWPEQ
jgi:serine/threonine protein kinase